MSSTNIEMDDEEVEYIVLKYIVEQIKTGKKFVKSSEIYEYLGSDLPEDFVDEKVVLSPKAEAFIKNYEAKHRPYLN